MEGEVTKGLLRCKLCTRICCRNAQTRVKEHVEAHHMVPMIVQHPNLTNKCSNYLKLYKKSEDGISLTYSNLVMDGERATLTDETETGPHGRQDESKSGKNCDHQTKTTKNLDTKNDNNHTNTDNNAQKQSTRTQETTDDSQNEPSVTDS